MFEDRDGSWWDVFIAERDATCPFLVDWPDENLVEWFNRGVLVPGRALELGCGHGRNAAFLAGRGCEVDAVDFSPVAIDRARERLRTAGLRAGFQCCSVFDADIADGAYDLVYDSGCFHHLPPHRRAGYVDLVRRALRNGGAFGLVCFTAEGGSGLDDRTVYEQRTLGGGLGYAPDQLRALWEGMSIVVQRPMRTTAPGERLFGQGTLSTLLARTP